MMTAWIVLALMVAVAVGLVAFRPRGGLGGAWLAGLATLYVGQRLLVPSTEGTAYLVVGIAMVLATLAWRARGLSQTEGVVRDATRDALIWQAVGSASILLWWLTTPTVTVALGLDTEAVARWSAVFTTLWPIVFVLGAVPTLLLDSVLLAHPVRMPPGARTHAVTAGLALALATCLVFPVNYLADAYDQDMDFSYFRVTRPGSSTQAIVASVDAPVEALLFFPPGNDVLREARSYFDELAETSDGLFSWRAIDQAGEPALAKELSVRDNGYIVLRQDDRTQKFKLDDELKRARRELRKLDGTVQENLLRLVSEERVAYVLTGHGEASPRASNPFQKLGDLKKLLLAQNYEVKDFGLEQGSGDEVPEDAALVIVAAPDKTLLDPELASLVRYIDRGGKLLIYAEPGKDPMTGLLGHLGVAVGDKPLAHPTKFVKITGGIVDRANLYSQRYGSHPVTSTLSKYASKAIFAVLGAAPVTETGEASAPGPAKYTTLVRSHEETWVDVDGDFQRSPEEPKQVHVLAMAVEGPAAHPYRAIVVGDVQTASDILIERVEGNAQFLLDGVRRLVGDEDFAGEVENEEDVQIEHTRESDTAWFYGTIFGVPLLILGLGAMLVRRRKNG